MFLDKVLRPMKPYLPLTYLSAGLVVVSPATELKCFFSNRGSDTCPVENRYLLCACVCACARLR